MSISDPPVIKPEIDTDWHAKPQNDWVKSSSTPPLNNSILPPLEILRKIVQVTREAPPVQYDIFSSSSELIISLYAAANTLGFDIHQTAPQTLAHLSYVRHRFVCIASCPFYVLADVSDDDGRATIIEACHEHNHPLPVPERKSLEQVLSEQDPTYVIPDKKPILQEEPVPTPEPESENLTSPMEVDTIDEMSAQKSFKPIKPTLDSSGWFIEPAPADLRSLSKDLQKTGSIPFPKTGSVYDSYTTFMVHALASSHQTGFSLTQQPPRKTSDGSKRYRYNCKSDRSNRAKLCPFFLAIEAADKGTGEVKVLDCDLNHRYHSMHETREFSPSPAVVEKQATPTPPPQAQEKVLQNTEWAKHPSTRVMESKELAIALMEKQHVSLPQTGSSFSSFSSFATVFLASADLAGFALLAQPAKILSKSNLIRQRFRCKSDRSNPDRLCSFFLVVEVIGRGHGTARVVEACLDHSFHGLPVVGCKGLYGTELSSYRNPTSISTALYPIDDSVSSILLKNSTPIAIAKDRESLTTSFITVDSSTSRAISQVVRPKATMMNFTKTVDKLELRQKALVLSRAGPVSLPVQGQVFKDWVEFKIHGDAAADQANFALYRTKETTQNRTLLIEHYSCVAIRRTKDTDALKKCPFKLVIHGEDGGQGTVTVVESSLEHKFHPVPFNYMSLESLAKSRLGIAGKNNSVMATNTNTSAKRGPTAPPKKKPRLSEPNEWSMLFTPEQKMLSRSAPPSGTMHHTQTEYFPQMSFDSPTSEYTTYSFDGPLPAANNWENTLSSLLEIAFPDTGVQEHVTQFIARGIDSMSTLKMLVEGGMDQFLGLGELVFTLGLEENFEGNLQKLRAALGLGLQ